MTHKNTLSGVRIPFLITFCMLMLAATFPPLVGPGVKSPSPIAPYFNGIFPDLAPNSMGGNVTYSIENAFPNLTFTDPVDLIELPNDKLMVIGKPGLIWILDNDPTTSNKTLALDISNYTILSGDSGLLGIVLHPEFGQADSDNSEYFYIFYRYTPISGSEGDNGYMRLSRFNLPAGATTINPSSELVLIQQFDRHDWHNGGDMFFGPDGFLYLPVGDEGGANDYSNVTQQIDKWLFSGVLRIDVDRRGGNISHPIRRQPQNQATLPTGSEWVDSYTQGYYIPNDNPWLDTNGGILEEFFSIGLRSPHRMTYDAPTGDIWIGDIGQGSREEISRFNRNTVLSTGNGFNLQWPYKEGSINGAKPQPGTLIGVEQPPAFDYPRSFGTCVIGGFVYRGTKYPELDGKYIFGDHTVQNIWTLAQDNGTWEETFLLNVPVEGTGSKDGISSFAQLNDGTILILDLFGHGLDGGKIHKLVRSDNSIDEPPTLLSEVGAFTDMANLTPAPGMIPYTVNAPLWSDRALKKRWIVLPNDGSHNTPSERISFDAEQKWKFPAGTVMVKHFELPINENDHSMTTRLETRFLIFDKEGGAYGITYRWNELGTDATLLQTGETRTIAVTKVNGNVEQQTWDFPSRQQCLTCHNGAASYALGINTRQINTDQWYPSTQITANQLETWNHLGMFDRDIGSPKKYPQSADIWDTLASKEFRIRSYLDANCSFCHQPNGVNGIFDARALTPLHEQMMVGATVISDGSPQGEKVIVPGQADHSVLYNRDNSLGNDAMPPLAKRIIDQAYIDLAEEWINGLAPSAPSAITESWYQLQFHHSGKLATVKNGHTYENADIIQLANSGSDAQSWFVQDLGFQKYALINKASNLVLSLENRASGTGTPVVQQEWNGGQHQMWYFEEVSIGIYQIRSAYNGLNAGLTEVEQGDGIQMKSAIPDLSATQQQFVLIPLSGSPVSVNQADCFGENSITDPLPKCRYSIKFVDSEEPSDGQAYRAFDNQINTIWHTEWRAQDPVHPHEIQLDLGKPFMVSAVNYLPRQDASFNGTIKNYEVFLSSDGANWGTPVASGIWPTTKDEKTAAFSPQTAQFVRLVALNEVNGNPWTSASEISIESSWCVADYDPIGETGKLSVDYNWQTVALAHTYNQPIVIPSSPSYNDAEDVTVRVRNVTPTSFDIRLEEWECSSVLNHAFEDVHYLVVEAGIHTLLDGSTIMAGRASDITHNWTTIDYSKPFVNSPIILTQCITVNEPERVVTRIDHANSNKDRFRVKLQEGNGSNSAHIPEEVAWIAIAPSTFNGNFSFESGKTGRTIDENWEAIDFNQCYENPVLIDRMSSYYGGDPSGSRHRNLSSSGVEVFVEEETCTDGEISHTNEEFHYLVFNRPGLIHGKTKAIVYVNVQLQGAMGEAQMDTYLADQHMTPLAHPYGGSPWNYCGNECVTELPADVVDWVLVSVRHPNDPAAIIEQRACFVRKDGTLVDTDGKEGVFFGRLALASGYISVQHRNHLQVMTSRIVTF